jgi:formate dehydrogenase iron-sulfur subunit
MTTPSPLFIEELLADQRNLTAVEQFSLAHRQAEFAEHARNYRQLIPLEAPKPGEQYAFEVELDKCSGCKACVTACHSLNGLDEHETWRDVGLLVSAPSKPWKKVPAIQQTVTTACHHCVEPACLEGCPVLAYEKDPATGIVRHLDDQCIGCQYCVLKCPYDVPKYNSRLGIVRKCDMCAGRLAADEAPACVQACPNEAIRITKVSKSEVMIQFREHGETFLTGAPEGDYTLPTTIYRNENPASQGPVLVAADASEVKPQAAHWPLVLMLVLSQASVGMTVVATAQNAASWPMLSSALALAVTGLGASIFHLGRPLGAWRAFLNLRRSWMSREIVAFGIYIVLLAASVAVALANRNPPAVFVSFVTLIGLLTVFCSAMIYHDTQRPLWNWKRSLPLFFGTTAILGAAGAVTLQSSRALLATIVVAVVAKLGVEIFTLRHGTRRGLAPLKKTALLVTGHFQHVAIARMLCVVTGGIGLPVLLMTNAFHSWPSAAAFMFILLLTAELLERYLFFVAVAAPKMPGNIGA